MTKTHLVIAVNSLVALVAALALIFSVATNQTTISRIDQDRRASILSSCRDQNQRNRNTIAYLQGVAAKQARHRSAAYRRTLRSSLAAYVLLIDDLAPYQNCTALLVNSTKQER